MPQNKISDETKETVAQFYNRDDIRSQLPGKRDCKSVKKNPKIGVLLRTKFRVRPETISHHFHMMCFDEEHSWEEMLQVSCHHQ
ncbi:hypothetical protein PR048_027604 [Dryococelus australis]|uniref:Uncharacterized protein n=1 Tax=Dryococelus australis TaxID=614101 RepID=A0ABQ9GH00_9NEOP|nr:hypothetical protein PR048_027604 [Dryococelus australis]